jgi:hypothetical protein
MKNTPRTLGVKKKYIAWSSIFFAKFILIERGRSSKVIFQFDVVHN